MTISSSPASLVSVGTAVPPCKVDQSETAKLVRKHYGRILKPRSLTVLEQVLAHPSIRSRHISVDSIHQIERLRDENADERMERFTKWAVDLSEQAVRQAIGKANLATRDIRALVVNTCTGYICPGISTYLIERLDLPVGTRAYDLVGAGCGAALPSLQVAQGLLNTFDSGAAVCVSVEICSATYQMDNDIALLISNAIFGDGAAAAVLTRAPHGAAMRATSSSFLPAFRDDVRFVYKNGQLHNRLSPGLPDITGREVTAFVNDFLCRNNLAIGDIRHWAIHPGGDKILSAIQAGLGLPDTALAVSRDILLRYGNMSSPTVLFELEGILSTGMKPGERCLMLAFGAGMAIHGVLLEQCGA